MREDLREGDWILLPDHRSGRETDIPCSMILARFLRHERNGHVIVDGLRILHPSRKGLLPLVSEADPTERYIYSQYPTTPPDEYYSLYLSGWDTNQQVWVGYSEISGALMKTPGYFPHAEALLSVWRAGEKEPRRPYVSITPVRVDP